MILDICLIITIVRTSYMLHINFTDWRLAFNRDTALHQVKLFFGPGDILVLRCPPDWTEEQRYMLHSNVLGAMDRSGKNNEVGIISQDVDLAVVQKS